MTEKRTEIVTAAVMVLVTFVGGMLWLTEIHAASKANAAGVNELKSYHGEILNELREMNRRLSRIEGKLE